MMSPNLPFEVIDLRNRTPISIHSTSVQAWTWVRNEITEGSLKGRGIGEFLVEQHVLTQPEIDARIRILQEQIGRLTTKLNAAADLAARSQDFHEQWESAMWELNATLNLLHRISSSGGTSPYQAQQEPGDKELEGYARRASKSGSDFLDHDHSMDG